MQLVIDKNGVCTKLVLSGFDETQYTCNTGNDKHNDGSVGDFDTFKKNLIKVIKRYQTRIKSRGESYSSIERLAVIEATTTTLQPIIEGHLAVLGFTRIGPFKKKKHPSGQLSVWIMHIPQFLEAIDWAKNVGLDKEWQEKYRYSNIDASVDNISNFFADIED